MKPLTDNDDNPPVAAKTIPPRRRRRRHFPLNQSSFATKYSAAVAVITNLANLSPLFWKLETRNWQPTPMHLAPSTSYLAPPDSANLPRSRCTMTIVSRGGTLACSR